MRIEAVQRVAATPEAVFARLADFGDFEARARRRNVPVERLDRDPPGWRLGVDWAGMSYTVDLQVVSVTRPAGYEATVETRGVEGAAVIAIAAEAGGSVLSVALDLSGRGLTGRMLMQTLGVARSALEGRLEGALRKLAAEIEAAPQA